MAYKLTVGHDPQKHPANKVRTSISRICDSTGKSTTTKKDAIKIKANLAVTSVAEIVPFLAAFGSTRNNFQKISTNFDGKFFYPKKLPLVRLWLPS